MQANVRNYYMQFEESQTQSLIDSKIMEFAQHARPPSLVRNAAKPLTKCRLLVQMGPTQPTISHNSENVLQASDALTFYAAPAARNASSYARHGHGYGDWWRAAGYEHGSPTRCAPCTMDTYTSVHVNSCVSSANSFFTQFASSDRYARHATNDERSSTPR